MQQIYVFEGRAEDGDLYDIIKYDMRQVTAHRSGLRWSIDIEDVIPCRGVLGIPRRGDDEELEMYEYSLPTMTVPGWELGRVFTEEQMTPAVRASWDALPRDSSISWVIKTGATLSIECRRRPLNPLRCGVDGRMYLYQPHRITLTHGAAPAPNSGGSAGVSTVPAEGKTPAVASTASHAPAETVAPPRLAQNVMQASPGVAGSTPGIERKNHAVQ